MPVTSCPFPTVINPLRVNGFKFSIAKLPEITYFISRCEIPQISLQSVSTSSPLSDSKYPGDKIAYGSFTLEFQVDEQMMNWNMIYFWLIGLGFPEDNDQYLSWLSMERNQLGKEMTRCVSDASLTPLSAAMGVLQEFTFVDLFPTSLQGPSFDATNSSNSIATATATFEYSYIKTSMPFPT